MKIIEIYQKLRAHGIKWFLWRCQQEIIIPTFPVVKKPIDFILRTKKKLGRLVKTEAGEYLYGIYDLEVSPITFNIAEFLCGLEIEAEKKNKSGFVVVFVPKKNKKIEFKSEYEKIIDEDSTNWRIDNILLQTTRLHPKCKGISILPDRSEVKHIIKKNDIYPDLYDGINLRSQDIVSFYQFASKPGVFKGLRATEQGKKYINQYIKERGIKKKIVTIVIRQYDYDSVRNSNLVEWAKFVEYLITHDYHPLIIPDTDNAFNKNLPFDNKYIFTDCCWNVQLRMALYEISHLNFSVDGGGGAIMSFNPLCSCIFMNMNPVGSVVGTAEASRKYMGLEADEQWKYLTEKQHLNFQSDTFPNIRKEFETFMTLLNSSNATN